MLWSSLLSLPHDRVLKELEAKINGKEISFSDILAKDLTKYANSVQIETKADFDLSFEFPCDLKMTSIPTKSASY